MGFAPTAPPSRDHGAVSTEQVAWRAATLVQEYRRSHSGIGLGDYLIAATALTEGLELATLNIRHYPMLPELTRPF